MNDHVIVHILIVGSSLYSGDVTSVTCGSDKCQILSVLLGAGLVYLNRKESVSDFCGTSLFLPGSNCLYKYTWRSVELVELDASHLMSNTLTIANLGEFFADYLRETGTLEAGCCCAAHRLAAAADPFSEWLSLNYRLDALKSARESRQASAALETADKRIVEYSEGTYRGDCYRCMVQVRR
ncbi:MAG: hypothetical protein IT324_24840 [Anaerolineae bacterium]|nr:hypothetical protein [Anaerolineae bacterium]